jgi:hypothetical protein
MRRDIARSLVVRPLGVTTTARVGEPDDWAEILGPISLERAQEIAEFARAGTLPAADIEYVLAGGGVFIVAVNVPGEARVCLSLTPRDAGFAAAA